MKKKYRLLKNKDFKKVISNKNSYANKEYILYISSNDLNHVRIGISVSSKIGNSVVRHKIKRQVSEMIKDIINFDEALDFVLILRKNYLENEFLKNKKELIYLVNKIKDRTEKKNEKKS